MSVSLEIVSCIPGHALLSEVLRSVYPDADRRPLPPEIGEAHLEHCLVVIQESQPAGYIALYRNRAIMHEGKPTVQLGHFECMNSVPAARALLDAAVAAANKPGASVVIGPMNGSTWNQYRFASEGAATPAFFTDLAHPHYYPHLWREARFTPIHHYRSNIAPVTGQHTHSNGLFENHALTERPIRADRLEEELQMIYPLCIAAFAHSPLYSPISRDEFVSKLMVLQPLLGGQFTRIVFNTSGQPVAFILCFPDILHKEKKTLILKTAAKHPGYAIQGVMTALYHIIEAHAHASGYEQIIHAFMHIDNKSFTRSGQFDGKVIRQYSLYAKFC